MPVSDVYARQVRLLVRTLPLVFQEPCPNMKIVKHIGLPFLKLERRECLTALKVKPCMVRD